MITLNLELTWQKKNYLSSNSNKLKVLRKLIHFAENIIRILNIFTIRIYLISDVEKSIHRILTTYNGVVKYMVPWVLLSQQKPGWSIASQRNHPKAQHINTFRCKGSKTISCMVFANTVEDNCKKENILLNN